MKRIAQILLAATAVAFVAGCGCTTETHTVRIKETRTYVPAKPRPSTPAGPEAFEPVNRY